MATVLTGAGGLIVRLNTCSWGHGGGSPIVCVHGVTGHAQSFRKLAEDTLADRRVLAMDLRGHDRAGSRRGTSRPMLLTGPRQPLRTPLSERPGSGSAWVAALVAELALTDPRLVDRLVLLVPVLHLPPEDGLVAAERERHEETYATSEEAVEGLAAAIGFPTPREFPEEEAREHLTEAADGRLRFRYSRSAAVAAWGEMTRPPVPPAGIPTLIVVGTESWVPAEEHLERYRLALGGQLKVERLHSQHWLLWNAFPATARAVRAFV